jgi:OmpA-OmpF porin, OOP family
MKTLQATRMTVLATAVLFSVGALGCATKKYVHNTVDPLGVRTADLEKKSSGHDKQLSEHDTQLEGLDRQVSAADERARSAGSKAQDAAASATAAQQAANSAGTQATEAQNLAQKGLAATDKLSTKIEELDNYRLVSSETVTFGLNKSELNEDGKSQLDAWIQKMGSVKHFMIQVEGFTDKTGRGTYNLELSRRRADSVVRYLVSSGKVPLYRIHVVGLGNANPVADNSTRKGRGVNRRVEVRLLAADNGPAGMAAAGLVPNR